MPLNPSALSGGLDSLFASPPPDAAACGDAWASAAESWAAGIVPPSTTVSTAAAALAGALTSAFSHPDCASDMESAFASFGAAVGAGMVGYVPTPPSGPVGFAPQFSGPKPATAAEAANAIATKIDTWMRTGLSTLVAPPGTVIPWT